MNEDTSQTEFTVVGGQSALSPGYAENETLNAMTEKAGISIEWNTMSDSLAEQVNIMIAGGELPDAFTGVGFSNYDLMTYGEDGTYYAVVGNRPADGSGSVLLYESRDAQSWSFSGVLDKNSVELFVNDGEQAATFLLYCPLEAQAISFESEGTVCMSVEKYDLPELD